MPIRVDGKDRYFGTHGRKPRGWGHWLFRIADEEKYFTGLFADAQKRALAYARKHHPNVFKITVLP